MKVLPLLGSRRRPWLSAKDIRKEIANVPKPTPSEIGKWAEVGTEAGTGPFCGCRGKRLMAKLIVLAALARITQNFIRLVDLLELRLGRWISRVDIGMISPGELSIRPLDLTLRGVSRNP